MVHSVGLFGGKDLNLIVGFDTFNYNLKIMRILGQDISTAKVDFVPVPKEHFINGEWDKIVSLGLSAFIKRQNFKGTLAVFLCLPDNVVGKDTIVVPTLGKAKMTAALESQMKELYNFYNDFSFKRNIILSNKTNTTFEVLMVSKRLLNGIFKALSEQKLYAKNYTFASNAKINALFALKPKTVKQSFIFLDINTDHSSVIFVDGGTTVGWKQLKFGSNVFLYDRVMIENNIVFNDVAERAVANAMKMAKMEQNSFLGVANSDIFEAQENESPISDGDFYEGTLEEVEDGQEDKAVYAVDREESEEKALLKKYKKLPSFMQRPVPDTIEGIRTENFRLFVKHVLLMKMQIEQGNTYKVPEYCIVNLPKEYAYVLEETNTKSEDFEFRLFESKTENDCEGIQHLDLYGVLFADKYNKGNNV